MKQRRLFMLLAVAAILLSKPALGFTQSTYTLSEIASDLKDVSDDIRGALAFSSLIGLAWSDTYVGQLIGMPPHWGIGLSMGITSLKADRLNDLLGKFGYTSDFALADKPLLLAYTIDLRIGGFKQLPFDIGIKWGLLPYAPLFGDISYEINSMGLDFRWEIVNGWLDTPSFSVGFEIDSVTGGLRNTGNTTLTGLSSDIVVGGDSTAGLVWEVLVFSLKAQVAKNFWRPRLNMYAGLRLGGYYAKTGYELSGGDGIMIGGTPLNQADLSGLASALDSASGNNTTFSVDEDTITGLREDFGAAIAFYTGLAFHFNSITCLDISLMLDVINFGFGTSIGFRYQQ
ncbi:MAG: hypothetical protein LBK66_05630 [Spirochaetaceae bacterium]|jgi:hypothetical protein|nr:hypothetical protein [Spirochaetaceae bacterium]